MTDFLLYTGIRDYIYARIEFLTEHILSKNFSLALTIVLALLTLWIMVQGFLIATGRSQEGLKGFVYGLGKSYLIIAIALAVASGSNFAIRTLTDDLADGISQIMTGKSDMGSECLTKNEGGFLGCQIDKSLSATQTIMSFMNSIDTADDPSIENKVDQMRLFAGVGTAGPGIVAGTMLIVYRIAMALFIGFAPVFILSLLFKKTAPLFQKWLYYGLATIFSSVLLGVMAQISMDLVWEISQAMFVSNTAIELLTGSNASGVMHSITQQLGLGLILSTLLIVVPPMAGMWFNGLMGQFNAYSPLSDRWNANAPVPHHVDGGKSYQQQVEQRVASKVEQLDRNQQTNNQMANTPHSFGLTKGGINTNTQPSDVMKSQSQIGQSQLNYQANNIDLDRNTDKNKSGKGDSA